MEDVEVAGLRLAGVGSRTGSAAIFATPTPSGDCSVEGLSGAGPPPGDEGMPCSNFGEGRSGVTAKFFGRGLVGLAGSCGDKMSSLGSGGCGKVARANCSSCNIHVGT